MKPKPARKIHLKKPVIAFVLNGAFEGLGFLYLKRWKWAAFNLGIAVSLGFFGAFFINEYTETDIYDVLASNYYFPVIMIYKVINGLIAYLAARYVNALPIRQKTKRKPKKRQSFVSSIRSLDTKEKIQIPLLLFTALAASLGAFAAYKDYLSQNQKPLLTLCVYKIEGKDEVPLISDEDESMDFTEIYSDGEFTEYALPMKILNSGAVLGDNILTWLDVEGGELILPQGWTRQVYANHDRWFMETPNLYPNAEISLQGIRVRVKNDTSRKVTIKWSILAKNASPRDGSITLHL